MSPKHFLKLSNRNFTEVTQKQNNPAAACLCFVLNPHQCAVALVSRPVITYYMHPSMTKHDVQLYRKAIHSTNRKSKKTNLGFTWSDFNLTMLMEKLARFKQNKKTQKQVLLGIMRPINNFIKTFSFIF